MADTSYELLRCTQHDMPFQWSNSKQTENTDGELKCDQGCLVPVIAGIPRFVPQANYADNFGLEWNEFALTQFDSHTKTTITQTRLTESTGWDLNELKGQTILEAGSGAGRFTEILVNSGANIYSFDMSSAVEANYKNNKASNLTLFQADITNIPLMKNAFDKVLCFGVLQHTPDPDASFRSLTKFVKPGGELCIDIYPTTFANLSNAKYKYRPFLSRLDDERLLKLCRKWVPRLMPLSTRLRNLSRPTDILATMFMPIADYYAQRHELSYEQRVEWSIAATFDWYSPAYDKPRTSKQVYRWFESEGFRDIQVFKRSFFVGKGTKIK